MKIPFDFFFLDVLILLKKRIYIYYIAFFFLLKKYSIFLTIIYNRIFSFHFDVLPEDSELSIVICHHVFKSTASCSSIALDWGALVLGSGLCSGGLGVKDP